MIIHQCEFCSFEEESWPIIWCWRRHIGKLAITQRRPFFPSESSSTMAECNDVNSRKQLYLIKSSKVMALDSFRDDVESYLIPKIT